MRKKASHLKYHIIHAEHAHAEGEFVQFLLKRNTKEEAETYTHVIGMGCSRQHCPECNCLLKLALGESYYNFTASLSDNRDEKEQVEVKLSPDIENQVLIDRSCQGTVPILYGANASSSKYFRQFSLKKMLSTWIGTITNIQIPNMERYNNADDAQQSGA